MTKGYGAQLNLRYFVTVTSHEVVSEIELKMFVLKLYRAKHITTVTS